MPASAAFLDPRTTLARPDLADQALEGVVRAAAFRTPRPMHGALPVADISAEANAGSERIDQLLFGEAFDVLDTRGDRVWGRARRDGVVGWMAVADLGDGAPAPTHHMAVAGGDLPLNALCGVRPGAEAIGAFERDPVLVAERLISTPHQPGARSSLSTDCAGLVQQALYACGLDGPRYADQQAELGHAVTRAEARRGDLVVWLHPTGGPSWTGHSALMLDADRLIHASGDRGGVVVEAFDVAHARYTADGFSDPVFRRL